MKDIEPKVRTAVPVAAEPLTGCVVCGSYEGKLSETAGKARWHAECGAARPDVIAKVKARA